MIEYHDLIQMKFKIQTKGNFYVRCAWVQLLTCCMPGSNSNETVHSNECDFGNRILEQCFEEISGHFC